MAIFNSKSLPRNRSQLLAFLMGLAVASCALGVRSRTLEVHQMILLDAQGNRIAELGPTPTAEGGVSIRFYGVNQMLAVQMGVNSKGLGCVSLFDRGKLRASLGTDANGYPFLDFPSEVNKTGAASLSILPTGFPSLILEDKEKGGMRAWMALTPPRGSPEIWFSYKGNSLVLEAPDDKPPGLRVYRKDGTVRCITIEEGR